MENVQKKYIMTLTDIDRLSIKKETFNPLLLDDVITFPSQMDQLKQDTTVDFSSWSFDWTGEIEVLSR